jgi:hypothetical protein
MKRGDSAHYVSPFRTGTYDAVITAEREDGTVDIDVRIPGVMDTLHLTKLKVGENARVKAKQ